MLRCPSIAFFHSSILKPVVYLLANPNRKINFLFVLLPNGYAVGKQGLVPIGTASIVCRKRRFSRPISCTCRYTFGRKIGGDVTPPYRLC